MNVGRYTIVRKLATGGMAEVFLAKVAGPGGFEKHVVLKKILPQLADNELFVNMFLAEARLAAQLDHPNIVHVFDFGELEGTYFLAMEYIEGANLRHVVRWAFRNDQPMSPTLAARVVAQACEGLSYAHEFTPPGADAVARIVHRDVSPENIMLARTGAVKLLDFGVAKDQSDDHRSKGGSLKGKIAYMPPEQVRGGPIDRRVDIYALGVVLYQCLSGKRPYGQATDVALISAILHDEPTPLLKHRLDLPDTLLEIVSRAMAKKPEDRYPDCHELREALEKYIAHEGVPAGSSQVGQLVARYLAANPTNRSGLASAPGPTGGAGAPDRGKSDAGESSKVESSHSGALREPPRLEPRPSGPLNQLLQHAAQTDPGGPGPFAAPAAPEGPDPLAGATAPPSVSAVSEVTTRRTPAIIPPAPSPGSKRPASPALPVPTSWSSPSSVARGAAPPPSAPRPDDAHAVRRWASGPIGAEPIRQALRESLRSDRSTYLLRKLPAVVGRLADYSTALPWSIVEAFCGVIDAALLADDHAALSRLLDRAAQKPGRDQRFAVLVLTELQSPLRIAWLVERLRQGLPDDVSALRSWLFRLTPAAAPLLVGAIEASDPGPAQEMFAEALAHNMPDDPSVVTDRLVQPKLSSAAALCLALERAQVVERTRVFQVLIGRREPALQVEVLTGRARARGVDSTLLLESALGDRSEEVRFRALELLGELGGSKAFALLQKLMTDATFEARPAPERGRFWAALLACGGDDAQAELTRVLATRPSLLNKRRVTETKLPVIEGLARARTEAARTVLEHVASDASQSDDVQTAARLALNGPVPGAPASAAEQRAVGERRARLAARVCLDLALLARASTTVDIASDMLDGAIETFRHALRQIVHQEGRVQLLITDAGPTLNNSPIDFGPFHAAVVSRVHSTLKIRDLKGFAVESALPLAEFKSLLLRAFDPSGKHERLPHIKAVNFAGAPLAPISEAPAPSDPTARAQELFAAVVRWVHAQRELLRQGRPIELPTLDATLDEWSRLVTDGGVRFMGLARWAAGETGTLVHGTNTAALSMAFAHDLGLSRSAVREAAELSVMLGLAEACDQSERRPAAGDPPTQEQRFHGAGLALTYRVSRLGTAVAVGAVEAGLAHEAGSRGAGVLASLHALTKTYDALTAGGGMSTGQALETLNGRLRGRFTPELAGLFTQWAFSQAAAT